MANTVIKLKSSGVTGNVPNNLEPGELAINIIDGKLFYGNTSCNAVLFDVNNPAGLEGELQFNNSGEFGSSANLKFDNTTKTLNVKNVFANGNVVTNTLVVLSTTNLGNVSNVTITGGSANQFLITDGLGNLSFGVGTMGAQGATGAQGAQGATGAQGAVGAQGVQGAVGAQGAQGATGAQGAVGAQGAQGAVGAQGIAGAQGVQGSTGQAAPWVLVTANTTAVSGQQLIANTQGGSFTITLPAAPYIGNVVRITDGYHWSINNLTIERNGSTIEGTTSNVIVDVRGTTVEFVYDNVTWQVVSTIGPMGNTGPQGIQGTVGPQGFQGVPGAQGAVGAQGAIGAQGVQGAVGAQGAQGPQGSTPAIGGSNTQIQFNNNGSLDGTANLVWNGIGLGIGRSNPAYPLDIVGYMRGTANNASVGNASSMQLTQNGSGDAAISFLIGATTEWLAGVDNSDSDSFKISNITGGGDFTGTGITLTTSGNLGIGTTSPDIFSSGFERNLGIRIIGDGTTSSINVSGGAASRIQFGVGTTRYGLVYQDASNFMQLGTTTALPISFVTNSTERMRIDSSGNLGIGTSSPGSRLDVSRSSTTTAGFDESLIRAINSGAATLNQRVDIGMRWEDGTYNGIGGISMIRESATARSGGLSFSSIGSDGNPTNAMRLDSSGNLGVGRIPGAARLDLEAASGQTKIILRNVGNTIDASTYVAAETGSSGDWANLSLAARHAIRFLNNGTENMRLDSSGNLGLTTSGYTLGSLLQLGRVFSFAQDINSGYLGAGWVGNSGPNYAVTGNYAVREYFDSALGTIVWQTAGTGTAGNPVGFATRMTLDNAGNLGLGTTTPSTGKFSDASYAFLNQSASTSTGTNIFASNSDNSKFVGFWSGHSGAEPAVGVKTGNALTFGKWAAINGTGGFTENMRIDSSGNVGIGTTSPSTYAGASGQLVIYGGVGTTFTNNPQNITLVNNGTIAAGLGTGILFSANYNNSIATTYAIISGIRENATSGSAAGALVFGTRGSGGGVDTERMRIDSAGYLSLGATASSASHLLKVQSTTVAGLIFTGPNSVANDGTLSATVGNGSLLMVSENNVGDGALFYCGYKSATITLISDPNNRYATSVTAGRICVTKSANDSTVTITNKLGSTASITFSKVSTSD